MLFTITHLDLSLHPILSLPYLVPGLFSRTLRRWSYQTVMDDLFPNKDKYTVYLQYMIF